MKTNGQIFLSRKFSVFYNINCVLWIKVLRFEKFVKIKYRKPYYQNNSALRSNKTPRGAFENLHCRGLRDTIWWFPVVDKCAHNATVNRQSWKKQNKNKQKKQKSKKNPGQSGVVNWRTDNTMANAKRTEGQGMILMTLSRKLKIEQHKPH
jgi:hypothetical protein